ALWQHAGGAHHFGYNIELNLDPTMMLAHGEMIVLGESAIEVRHTPGHSPGHVIFYAAGEQVCFCGDVIFRRSIGRTDLPGGSHEQLLESIRSQVLSLPGETRLLSGHGPETTVANEVRDNPYLM
ncbi:MAG: MBL fold metallo-hydrolase, partial [Anaerolineae bacterium]|nr:MBL fold metallo-hydrolase [Anaerolineae bacterium]